MAPRNRVKELIFATNDELEPNPNNPRVHDQRQREVLAESLNKFGITDAVLGYRRPNGKIRLIDGHMRREEIVGQKIPILLLDIESDEEADQILAVHDPIGDLAMFDDKKFKELVEKADIHDGALAAMLAQVETVIAEEEKKGTGTKKPDLGRYPIAPVFSEKYDYAVIVCKTVVEFAWLQTFLKMVRQKSYKSSSIGWGRAIFCTQFMELIEEYTKSIKAGTATTTVDEHLVKQRAAEMLELAGRSTEEINQVLTGTEPNPVEPPGE